jgi:xanthine dehydrogenase accessory factor
MKEFEFKETIIASKKTSINQLGVDDNNLAELLNDIERWQQAGKQIAVARVVDIEGSGPRDPGAAMAVNEDGEVVGSVSGGCVEGAVVAEALEILRGDKQPRLVKFGYSDDEAFAVGLTCGGIIHLFIAPLTW